MRPVDYDRSFTLPDRIDRHVDRTLFGQQISRYVGFVIATDRNILKCIVGSDVIAIVNESYRKIGKVGFSLGSPDIIHRQFAACGIDYISRVRHFGRFVTHNAGHGIERGRHGRKSHLDIRRVQCGIRDSSQIVGFHIQLSEWTLQGYRFGESAFDCIVRQTVEESIEIIVVTGIVAIHGDGGQVGRVVMLVLTAFRAVGPKYEIIGLRRYQTQVESRFTCRYGSSLTFAVQNAVAVNFHDTAIDLRSFTEIRGRSFGLYLILRNRHSNDLAGQPRIQTIRLVF